MDESPAVYLACLDDMFLGDGLTGQVEWQVLLAFGVDEHHAAKGARAKGPLDGKVE